jgi:hypothetical protein
VYFKTSGSDRAPTPVPGWGIRLRIPTRLIPAGLPTLSKNHRICPESTSRAGINLPTRNQLHQFVQLGVLPCLNDGSVKFGLGSITGQFVGRGMLRIDPRSSVARRSPKRSEAAAAGSVMYNPFGRLKLISM